MTIWTHDHTGNIPVLNKTTSAYYMCHQTIGFVMMTLSAIKFLAKFEFCYTWINGQTGRLALEISTGGFKT